MPKYGIHHIVLKEAVPELYALGNNAATSAADVIQAETPSALMGSIGPDLFFWGPDYDIVNKLDTLYLNFEDVLRKYNNIVKPIREIKDAVVEPVEDLVETLAPNTVKSIRRFLREIEEKSSLFKSAVGTGLFAGVLEGANLLTDAAGIGSLSHQFFQMFVPDLQENNKKEKDWYWFDMLHYRRTGNFARNLVNGANSDRQKAFAFGYLSHIATDVTGHAYVNQIVGTAYRLNVHRHVTVENFQDTWKYARYYNGESINQTLFARLGLPENLPSDIGDLLHDAFKETYTGFDHPITRLRGDGFYTRDQIDGTYEFFYRVLKLMGSMFVERPEEPFSGVADILADALDNFSPPPSPPSSPSPMCSFEDILPWSSSSNECYEEFFKQVDTWLNYIGELIVWSFETLANLIDLLLTLLLSLPISVLLAILYGIQLLCYQIYRSARMVLSTNGFVMPEPDELDNSIARNLITLFPSCAVNFKTFPSTGTPVRNNLVCPIPTAELPSTAAAFHPKSIEMTPDRFINEEPFSEIALQMYACNADNPEQTRSVHRDYRSIGNSRDFTAWMIRHANDPNITDTIQNMLYTDWNLDADRGYGYRTWRGNIPNDEPFTVEGEEYL